MKRIISLLIIMVALLICVGITYAASYENVSIESVFEEGDTLVITNNDSDWCISNYNQRFSYCIKLNESQVINYYVPQTYDGHFDMDNFNLVESQRYNGNNTYVMPNIDDGEYLWVPKYNNENDLEFYAVPKLMFDLNCDSLDGDDLITCRVITKSANFSYSNVRFNISYKGFKMRNFIRNLNFSFMYGLFFSQNSDVYLTRDDLVLVFDLSIDENSDILEKDRMISISDLTYTNYIFSGYYKDRTTNKIIYLSEITGNQTTTESDDIVTKTDDNDVIDNPKTGYIDYVILLVCIVFISGICLYFIKSKELLK